MTVKYCTVMLAVIVFTLAKDYYIITTYSSSSCQYSALPCLTLTEFATNTSTYLSTNITLVLQAGNHTLETRLKISNISSLNIYTNSEMTETNIICSDQARLEFEEISMIEMSGVEFSGCQQSMVTTVDHYIHRNSKLTMYNNTGSTLTLRYVSRAEITACSFLSNTLTSNSRLFGSMSLETDPTPVSVLSGIKSSIVIRDSKFENNIATNLCHKQTNRNAFCSGTVYSTNSTMVIIDSDFFNNQVISTDKIGFKVYYLGGALYVADNSIVTVQNCNFTGNAVRYGGGALYLDETSNVMIDSSEFSYNSASNGGAILCYSSSFNSDKNYNSLEDNIVKTDSCDITIHNSTFSHNIADVGGAIHTSSKSQLNYDFYSTILESETKKLNVINCSFIDNVAKVLGGAIYAVSVTICMKDSTFMRNSVTLESGGALYLETSLVYMRDVAFIKNTAKQRGGAIYTLTSHLYANDCLHFSQNVGGPGVFYILHGKVDLEGMTTFDRNRGSVYAFNSRVNFTGESMFKGNKLKDNYTTNRSADMITEGGAVTCVQSTMIFNGKTSFLNNIANRGGAIKAFDLNRIKIFGILTIANNSALTFGGGIFMYRSKINFAAKCIISNNSAVDGGGAVHGIASTIKFYQGSLHFVGNYARKGGAVYFTLNAKLYIIKFKAECEEHITDVCYNNNSKEWMKLEFVNNTADLGGAIFIDNNDSSDICETVFTERPSQLIGECFFQVLAYYRPKGSRGSVFAGLHIKNMFFTDNRASIAGNNIHGGLLDRCTVNPLAEVLLMKPENSDLQAPLHPISYLLNVTNLNINSHSIGSHPLQIWFCKDNKPDHSYKPSISVKKGELFTVSVVAVDQINNTVSTMVHSSVNIQNSRFREGQRYQRVGKNCTEITFNVYSPESTQELWMYAKGPCNHTGISLQIIDIEFSPCTCPIGFQSSQNEFSCDCQCDSSLFPYITSCNINMSSILKQGSFWITHCNTTDGDYVIYPYCPFDYCHKSDTYINFNVPHGEDAQCAFSRSGVLCGSCEEGLSLCLGSSQCMQCSSAWLLLVFPFAIAGIALIAFLLVCNLTVAVGTLNGLIFYANIVIVNRSVFIPFQKSNIMTVFIAWLNLDLGLGSCFYGGMNAYIKTWLQFVFPLYLIILLVVIILASEKSSRFASLLGNRNPIATLVTVIMLSYTKVLRTIIDILAYAIVPYPHSHQTVWYFDGNVNYLEGKHIPLFIAAIVIIAISFVFTLLLFSWQWLLQCLNKDTNAVLIQKWITGPRINFIMDAYHAPFNPKHRYWSGLLLFVRVFLYIIAASGSTRGDPRANLVSIIITVAGLTFLKLWLGGKVYKKWVLNILEDIFFINIIIFSVATLYVTGNKHIALVYTSTGTAFAILIIILTYHLFAYVLKDLTMIKMLFTVIQRALNKFGNFKHDRDEYDTQFNLLLGKPSTADYVLAESPTTTKQPVTSSVV